MKNSIKIFEAKIKFVPRFSPVFYFNKVRIQLGENWWETLDALYRETEYRSALKLVGDEATQLKKAKLIVSYCKQKDRYKGTKLFMNSFNRIMKACHHSVNAAESTLGIRE